MATNLLKRPNLFVDPRTADDEDVPPVVARPVIVPPPAPALSPDRAAALDMLQLPSQAPFVSVEQSAAENLTNNLPAYEEMRPVSNTPILDALKEKAVGLVATRPSQQTAEQIRQIEGSQAVNTDKGFWSKFGDVLKNSGLGFLRGYGQTGSLWGGLGGAATGGIQQIADPATDEKRARLNKIAELYGQYDRESKIEEVAAKQRKSDLDNQTAQQDLIGKVLGNATESTRLDKLNNEDYLNAIKADDIVTEEESSNAAKRGINLPAYDARKFEKTEVGGVTFSTPDKGAPAYKTVDSLPINPEKVFKEITTPNGNKYQLTQAKAADLEIAIAQGDAARAMQVLLKNAEIENDNIQEKNKYENSQEEALATRDAALGVYQTSSEREITLNQEIGALQSQIAGLEEYSRVNIGTAEKPYYEIRPNRQYGLLSQQIQSKQREFENVSKSKLEAQKIMNEKESLFNRRNVSRPAQMKKVAQPPRLSKGGKNSNIGTVNGFKSALDRIK